MSEYQLLTQLLDLPQVRVTGFDLIGAERLHVTIESSVEAAVCPTCQRVSATGHGYADPQRLRDLSIWQRHCWLDYRPRRFKCASCQSTFVERVGWRAAEFVYTVRYEQRLYQRARHEPIAHIAQQEQLSEDIVQGIFERGAKKT